MILKILGLPPDISKIGIRELIQQKCGLSQLLLDELCLDRDGSQRVTVGCQDENDGAVVLRQLHRTKLGSYTISVVPFRPISNQANDEFTRIDQEYYRTQNVTDTKERNARSDFRSSSYEDTQDRTFSRNGDEYYQKHDNMNMTRDGPSSELRNSNFTEPVNREFSRNDEFYKKYDDINTSSDFRNSKFAEPMDKEFCRKEHTKTYQKYDTVDRTRDHSSSDYRETNFMPRMNRELYKNNDEIMKSTRDLSSSNDRISHFTESGFMSVTHQSNSIQVRPQSDAQQWGQIVLPETAPWGKIVLPETAPWGKIVLPETAPWGKILVPETAPWGKIVLPETAPPWGKIVVPESATLYQPRMSRWDIKATVPGTSDGWREQPSLYVQQIKAMQVINENTRPRGLSPEKRFEDAARDFHPTDTQRRSRWDHSHPDSSLKRRRSPSSDGFRRFDSPGNDKFAQRNWKDHPGSTTSSFEPQRWGNSNRRDDSSPVRYPGNQNRPSDAFKSGPSWGNQKRQELQSRSNRQSSPVQLHRQDEEPGKHMDLVISKAKYIITQKVLIKESSRIYTHLANPEAITNDLRDVIGARLRKIVDPSAPITVGRLIRLYGEVHNPSTDTQLVQQVLARRQNMDQTRDAKNEVEKGPNKKEPREIDVSVKIWKDYASLILANEIFEKGQEKLITPKPQKVMHFERKFIKSKLTSMIMERMDTLKPEEVDNIRSAASMKRVYRQSYPETTDKELLSAAELELSNQPTNNPYYARNLDLKVTLSSHISALLDKATNEISLDIMGLPKSTLSESLRFIEKKIFTGIKGKVLLRLRNLAYEHHAELKRMDDVMKMYYKIFNKKNDRVMLARETRMIIEQGPDFPLNNPTSEFISVENMITIIVAPVFTKFGIFARRLKKDVRKIFRERIMDILSHSKKELSTPEVLKLYSSKYSQLADSRMVGKMKERWEVARNEAINVDDIEIKDDDLEDY